MAARPVESGACRSVEPEVSMRVLSAAKGEVTALGFAPDRPALVAVYERSGVFVWNLASAEPPVGFGEHTFFRPRPLTFSPDGQHVLQTAHDGHIAIDLTTGKVTRFGPRTSGSLSAFARTPDGGRLVIAQGPYYTPKLSGWRVVGGAWVEDWSV